MSDSTGVLVRTRDDDLFTNPEALALTGFLAATRGSPARRTRTYLCDLPGRVRAATCKNAPQHSARRRHSHARSGSVPLREVFPRRFSTASIGSPQPTETQGRRCSKNLVRAQNSNSTPKGAVQLVGLTRIELVTSSLSGMRSNQLSYSPSSGRQL